MLGWFDKLEFSGHINVAKDGFHADQLQLRMGQGQPQYLKLPFIVDVDALNIEKIPTLLGRYEVNPREIWFSVRFLKGDIWVTLLFGISVKLKPNKSAKHS